MEIIRKTLKAFIVAVCVFLILTVILSLLISFTSFPEHWTFGGLIGVLSVVTFLFSYLEGGVVGKRGLLTGLAASIFLMVTILLIVSGLIGDVLRVKNLDVWYLLPMLSGMMGGILGANGGNS